MPSMIDPMDSLKFLQQAIDENFISFLPCDIHSEVVVHSDTPNDTPRFTYAILDGQVAQSVALFVLTQPVEGVHCFQMGWATIKAIRGKGLATNVVSKGLAELKNGMKQNGIEKFYIEAIIAESNTESIKIATRLFSKEPRQCTDSYSGASALQFLKFA